AEDWKREGRDGLEGRDGRDRKSVFASCSSCPSCPSCRRLARIRGCDGQLRPDNRADTGGERSFMKARRPVDAIAIDKRERGISEVRRAIDERFGQRRALKKAEGG